MFPEGPLRRWGSNPLPSLSPGVRHVQSVQLKPAYNTAASLHLPGAKKGVLLPCEKTPSVLGQECRVSTHQQVKGILFQWVPGMENNRKSQGGVLTAASREENIGDSKSVRALLRLTDQGKELASPVNIQEHPEAYVKGNN